MELLFSAILAVFCVYGFFASGNFSGESTNWGTADRASSISQPFPGETAGLGAAFWPRMILVLLFILLLVNIANSKNARRKSVDSAEKGWSLGNLLKSRPVVGMVLIGMMVLLLPVIGFVPDCLVFLFFYGFLLGERRCIWLAVRSAAATIALYMVFQGVLGMTLARGVGMFWKLALFFESLFLI